jgi:uncharacterized protein
LILFCDSSALVKLYIEEVDSDVCLGLAQQANAIAVSRIAWAEAHAAFARRIRDNEADRKIIEQAKQRLAAHWSDYFILEVSQPIVESAADYADAFALRAYDSVQLASATALQGSTTEAIHFACFDLRLRKAAQVLRLII